MTCKVKLFIFLSFIGVLGLNYYIDADKSGSGAFSDSKYPKSGLSKAKLEYVSEKTSEIATRLNSETLKLRALRTEHSDTTVIKESK